MQSITRRFSRRQCFKDPQMAMEVARWPRISVRGNSICFLSKMTVHFPGSGTTLLTLSNRGQYVSLIDLLKFEKYTLAIGFKRSKSMIEESSISQEFNKITVVSRLEGLSIRIHEQHKADPNTELLRDPSGLTAAGKLETEASPDLLGAS
ncbi:hypothetical protein MJT46_010300 [Ovis ammon polii x Ovis aries]|nr:hypothetical protein MJT46_010300 [Ovis ammon polii x Ovis aries]